MVTPSESPAPSPAPDLSTTINNVISMLQLEIEALRSMQDVICNASYAITDDPLPARRERLLAAVNAATSGTVKVHILMHSSPPPPGSVQLITTVSGVLRLVIVRCAELYLNTTLSYRRRIYAAAHAFVNALVDFLKGIQFVVMTNSSSTHLPPSLFGAVDAACKSLKSVPETDIAAVVADLSTEMDCVNDAIQEITAATDDDVSERERPAVPMVVTMLSATRTMLVCVTTFVNDFGASQPSICTFGDRCVEHYRTVSAIVDDVVCSFYEHMSSKARVDVAQSLVTAMTSLSWECQTLSSGAPCVDEEMAVLRATMTNLALFWER